MIKKIEFLLFLVFPVIFTLFSFQSVHAAADEGIMNVIETTELYHCYVPRNSSGSFMEDTIRPISEGFSVGVLVKGNTGETVKLPNGYGNELKGNYAINCRQLISGKKDIIGVEQWKGIFPGLKNMGQNEAKNVLTKLGYEPENDANGGGGNSKCVRAGYGKFKDGNRVGEDVYYTPYICVNNIDNPDGTNGGKITANSKISKYTISSESNLLKNVLGGATGIGFSIQGEKKAIVTGCPTWYGGSGNCDKSVEATEGMSWNDFKDKFYEAVTARRNLVDINNGTTPDSFSYQLLNKTVSGSLEEYDNGNNGQGGMGSNWKFKGRQAGTAAKVMLQNRNSSWTRIEDVVFTHDQMVTLHTYYINEYYKAKIICEGDEGFDDLTSDAIDVSGTTGDKCYATLEQNSGKKVRGVACNGGLCVAGSESSPLTWFQEYSFADLVKTLTKEELMGSMTGTSGSSSGTGTEDDEDDCYKAGVESIAWLLCPAINNGSKTLDGISQVLDSWLNIPVKRIFTGTIGSEISGDESPKDTYQAWAVFRNIANIVLSIIFLIIIFSQLTGYGIDNYGIKKALPRLVVMAILINLSYVLCEIAVDLSNILGIGLQKLFYNIGININPAIKELKKDWIVKIVTAVLAAAVAGLYIGSTILNNGAAAIISLVLVLLIALIAVLMFFVMLGARMVIVIIFTIISPVAFALCILPNTKDIFKKWWKIYKTCLVIYPICGALYGASFIIKAIVFQEGEHTDFFWQLVAILAPYLPFLMLPSLLKGALSALGTVGGAIAMIGSGLTKGARSAKNSVESLPWYKEKQQYGAQRMGELRAQKIVDKLSKRGSLSAAKQDKLRRAQDIVAAQGQRREENRLRSSGGYLNAVINKQNVETQNAYQDTMLYGNADYVAAQKTKAQTNRDNAREDTMLYNDTDYVVAQNTKAENARKGAMGEAHVGVLPITQAEADQRAASTRQAQEMKSWSDKYSQYSRADMEEEFKVAIDAYNGDRSQQNAIRLSAVLAAAEDKGMQKEILNTAGKSSLVKFTDLQFDNGNTNDSIVLNQLTSSGNRVLNLYGKARGKNAGYAASVNEFINGTAGGRNSDSLQDALQNKGSDALVGMDDDTLSHIQSAGGANAMTTEMLMQYANQTNDEKVLTQINGVLGTRKNATSNQNYQIKTSDLTKIKLNTLNSLDSSVWAGARKELSDGLRSNNQSAWQIYNGMSADVKGRLFPGGPPK